MRQRRPVRAPDGGTRHTGASRADPRFATNADRVANRESLVAALEAQLTTEPAAHWEQRLRAAGVAAAPVNDIGTAFAQARDLGLTPTFSVGDDHPAAGAQPDPVLRQRALDDATLPLGVGEHEPSRGGLPASSDPRPTLDQPTRSLRERHSQPADPLDLAGLDDLFTADERIVRDSVRTMCERRIDPYVADWFEREIDDIRRLTKELGELGVLGTHLTGYGCAGMSAVDYGPRCARSLEASDSGIRSLVSVQGSLAMFGIWRYSSASRSAALAAGHGGRHRDRPAASA
ncbi:MAG: acyl-CoA dehydrogenase family protein [Dermatophilaceae bacterium]